MPRRATPQVDREPLTRQRVLRAAVELADAGGVETLSMRKLGAALGVEAMSLYHHFPSKAHLFDALLDRLVVESSASDDRTLPWRERARLLCLSYRNLGRRYPEFARFMILHRMNTRGGRIPGLEAATDCRSR